jgi:hypothetical protein
VIVSRVEYFTFDLGDRTAGLLRLIRSNDGTILASIETVQGERWVADSDAIKYFWCYGGDQTDVVELSLDEARTRAASLGVDL